MNGRSKIKAWPWAGSEQRTKKEHTTSVWGLLLPEQVCLGKAEHQAPAPRTRQTCCDAKLDPNGRMRHAVLISLCFNESPLLAFYTRASCREPLQEKGATLARSLGWGGGLGSLLPMTTPARFN